VLLDLVLAELLARIELDQDCSRGLVRVQHHRRTAATRRLDLVQVPPAHGTDPTPGRLERGLAERAKRHTFGTVPSPTRAEFVVRLAVGRRVGA
jgi:hypothetical protein